jgi:hypothetical protein
MSTNREYFVEMVVSAFTKVIKELTPKATQTNVPQSSPTFQEIYHLKKSSSSNLV